ncbi:hypothetical protein ACCE15_19250 [Pseudomonas parafulva]|uniref:hypothetical protein n=1 Tax=Pseudomonas parafulva TaxID=157782 RepID=UPI003569400A
MKKQYYTEADLPEIMGISASEYLEYEELQSQALTDESEISEAIRFEQTGKVRKSSKNKK